MTPRPLPPVWFSRPQVRPQPLVRQAFGDGLRIVARAGDVDLCDYCEFEPGDCPSLPASVDSYSVPFAFRRATDVLPADVHEVFCRWMEEAVKWKPVDSGFYRADVFAITPDTTWPSLLDNWLGVAGVRWAEDLAKRLFDERLVVHGPIVLHRMVSGHGVGIHSDEPRPGEETHRIVLTLCRPRPPTAGGHFVLFDDQRPDAARALITLRSNDAIAFQLESRSYHAITSVRAGTRYSVVISLRGQRNV